ncbi:hypothetical protein BCR39DRAFT_84370 [Naematelia encephala]|uniref:Uncharacterized protein n=1 Tax=Naematelia encephala TaxID=71784 RepID=A0A1Y2ACY8_9TREE|nr:hypothetical protein BCR39DRAFT_84370 [Naematelia encephala]
MSFRHLTCVQFLFAGVALSFYRQLLDPSLVRSRASQPQAFAMQPGSYYPPPTQDQSWMVPPYPGPPGNAPPPPTFEKSDYQPDAEWAQAEYAPPPGAPPGSRGGVGEPSGLRAQEEAWLNAQRTGPTAHLTGHGPGPREEDEDEDVGFVVPNPEEDEAWERARQGGVTAHLTGQTKGRRGSGEV